jgi:nitrate/TMAO reductase-like tetraheme cytochrome c subunit
MQQAKIPFPLHPGSEMNKTNTVKYILSITSLISVLFQACGSNDHATHSTIEKIKSASKDSITYEISRKDLIDDTYLIMAEDVVGNSLFLIPSRSHELTNFPCKNCHNVGLDELHSQNPEVKKAHWDIEFVHADQAVMNCLTCHNNENLESLVSLNRKAVSFDNSQNLCAQCHTTQFADWKGGAHGKALAGWVDPRVSYTCVNCHNPHKPAFQSRWPARLNTVKFSELDPDK